MRTLSTKEPRNRSALILASPGCLRESLKALLIATPPIGTVSQADDVRQALRTIEIGWPDLVLMDVDGTEEEVRGAIATLQAACPTARLMLLVDVADEKPMSQGTSADLVVLKGTAASKLSNAIKKLASSQER